MRHLNGETCKTSATKPIIFKFKKILIANTVAVVYNALFDVLIIGVTFRSRLFAIFHIKIKRKKCKCVTILCGTATSVVVLV